MKRKNFVKFNIKSLNQEKIIEKIARDVSIYNFKREEYNKSSFESEVKNKKLVKKILEEHGAEILSISYNGLILTIKNLLKRIGCIVGIVLFSLFYVIQYNFIVKICVLGANNQISNEISSFVSNNLETRLKRKIDIEKLEKDIIKNFDEVSSVSVAIVGQSLIINIYESVLPEEMEECFSPLVSQFDGIITEIRLLQGTLAVEVGTIVQEGDVLVYPYVIDSQGQHRAVMPKAEIYADVWYMEEYIHYDYYFKTERTGKTFTLSNVYLNKLLIYQNNTPIPFEQYEVETKKKCLTRNNILPLIMEKIVYHQTATYEVSIPFDEHKEEVIEKARKKTLIFLQENEIIREENYTIREQGGYHQISYVITVSKNIGG